MPPSAAGHGGGNQPPHEQPRDRGVAVGEPGQEREQVHLAGGEDLALPARGEVVVVEDSFGIKITELVGAPKP